MERLRILTWHVHGGYLLSLAHVGHELYVPVLAERKAGDGRLGDAVRWPANVHEVPVEDVPDLELDLVVTQSVQNWEEDRHTVLAPAQRDLPRAHIEHDPPRASPTDQRHHVDDPRTLVVHVTSYNDLMWDSGASPTCVIEHGIPLPAAPTWTGELPRGVAVVNHLARRGRRLGRDVFEELRAAIPLDLLGMGAEELGGIGEVPHRELPTALGPYRFYVHPIRHTSLGLAALEAMGAGLPVVGLATTELPMVVRDGVEGYVDTDLDRLVARMRHLLADPEEAARLGANARRTAEERFSVERFAADWDAVLEALAMDGPTVAATTGRRRHLAHREAWLDRRGGLDAGLSPVTRG